MDSNDPNAVLPYFSIERKDYEIKPISQGYINDTYALLQDGGPCYILQRLNAQVFSNIDVLMQNIHHALPYLNDKNYCQISLIRTIDGKPYLKINKSHYWRMLTMVPDSIAFNTTQDKGIALEAGKIIGKFHSLLQEAPIDIFKDSIPGFHDLNLRARQFTEALGSATPDKLKEAEKAILFVKMTLKELREWVAVGTRYFRNAFGYAPRVTGAPVLEQLVSVEAGGSYSYVIIEAPLPITG